jgi:tetratricopeptide (TPR) repeat protein
MEAKRQQDCNRRSTMRLIATSKLPSVTAAALVVALFLTMGVQTGRGQLFGPRTAADYYKRGTQWRDKQEHDKAITDYTEAIRLDPTKGDYYYSRGRSWEKKHNYDKAIEDYTEAIRLNPMDADSYLWRASCWKEKREYDNAIKDCNEVIRINPDGMKGWAIAYDVRGTAWQSKGESLF